MNVEATAQVLDTDSATVSETIGKRAIVDLPSSGRNVWSLASTTPGVLGGLNSDIGLSFRGAGQREIQNSLSLDGINSSSNLLAATSMRPIADAVDGGSGPDRQHVGRVRVLPRRPHQRRDQERHQQPARLGVRTSSRTTRSISAGYFENRALPKNPRRRNQFGFQMDGPVVHARSSTTATTRRSSWARTKASESDALSTPFNSVPTALMRQGNFSEITTRASGTRCTRPARFPATSSRRRMLSPVALKLLEYYPAPNLTGTTRRQQPPEPERDDATRSISSSVRVDQNVGNKIRLSVRYNWHDTYNSNIGAIPVQGITQPRVNKNTLVSYTHTLKPTPATTISGSAITASTSTR